jgi:hypothetical protein
VSASEASTAEVPGSGAAPGHHPVDRETVEAVVRSQMARALGGRRGMAEAAAPTICFTVSYVTTKDVRLAIAVSLTVAGVLLALRLLQRSTVQFVMNSLLGIGVGCFFVWLGGRNGGDADQQALAYFLPGLIYNAGYAVVMILSILVTWPVVGFMVGSVAGDPTEWHRDPQVVRLCRNLTWVLVVPCVLRVLVQVPIYLGGRQADDAQGYVAALGLAKLAMGWPLQLTAFAAMVWLLARNRTPVQAG